MSQLQQLGQKATRSLITLTSRTFILNVISFLGAFALTVFLSPHDFGVFIITSTVVEVLTYFSDIGLAGALIQKKEDITDKEIHATFTIQMTLVTIGILIALIFTQPIQRFYGLDSTGTWLFYSLLVAFFLSSLKTIPSVLSERKLEFDKIVIPQIAETIIFNIVIVYLAWKGWGVNSYILAVLSRSLVGTVIIYTLVPYKPALNFSLTSVKKLLSFGIPYQLNSVIALLKDKISLLILGKIIGLEGMGILGWAEKWANMPLRYFLDSANKVSFPLFSRLQSDNQKVTTALNNAIYFISMLVFPMLAGAYLVMPEIITSIPKYIKWQPGLTTFNLFLISASIAAISTFFTNFLTAMGKMKQVLGLMIMWTLLTLTLYPVLAIKYGYQGVAIGSVLISLTSLTIPYFLVQKVAAINLVHRVGPAIAGSAVMIGGVTLLNPWLHSGYLGLVERILAAGILYGGVILLCDFKTLKTHILTFIAYAKA